MSRLPTTIDEVLARLRAIDGELPPGDGVAVFNRMYLTVTERVGALVDSQDSLFTDHDAVAELDVVFASLWLSAYDQTVAGRRGPAAWRPLFSARRTGRWPIQYALAGMNTHIEHDLPIAVTRTCERRRLRPDDLQADYQAVNAVLADVEAEVRRGFLSEVGRLLDDEVGPVVHLVSAWKIDKARDVAWVTAETLWALRNLGLLQSRFLGALGHTVGMASRTLLTPTR